MVAMNLLSTHGLSRHFGGLKAVENLDFELPEGEIRALIGPNGAGKTTFVSLICGRIPASGGTIRFNGSDVTGMAAHKRVGLGIAYTFQITSIYERLSCFDNIALAAQHGIRRMRGTALSDLINATLTEIGLAEQAQTRASILPYGHKRLLEVGLGLALKPRLLILDEPTQGLSDGEIDRFCSLVRSISQNTTILLIEHNMPVVMRLADRITVLNQGEILAEGTPEQIRNNRLVREAYLGG